MSCANMGITLFLLKERKFAKLSKSGLPVCRMSVSMDEVNYLVWRYMQENGFPHAAFVFDTECNASATNISGAQVPPCALITLLQKSLIYLKIEKRICEARKDTSSKVAAEIEKIERAFSGAKEEAAAAASVAVKELGEGDCQMLKGLSQAVCSVKFSPDGGKIAALEADGRCVIWTGEKSVVCGKAGAEIVRCPAAVSWNSTSDLVAVAGSDDTSVFKLDGEAAVVIPGGASVVRFCKDRPLLAVCTLSDHAVKIYEILENSSRTLESFSVHRDVIYDVAWRDQGLLATASGDRCVGVFTVSGTTHLLRAHTQPVTAVSFSAGSGMLASGGDDGIIYIWKDGVQSAVLKGHSGGITGLAWHPTNHSLVASSSADGSVKVWDAISGECQLVLAHHTNGITALEFHPSGNFLVTGGRDKIFAIWSFPEGKMVQGFTTGKVVKGVAMDSTGENLAVCFDAPSALVLPLSQYLH